MVRFFLHNQTKDKFQWGFNKILIEFGSRFCAGYWEKDGHIQMQKKGFSLGFTFHPEL